MRKQSTEAHLSVQDLQTLNLTCNKPPQGPPTMWVHEEVPGHCTGYHSHDRPEGALDPACEICSLGCTFKAHTHNINCLQLKRATRTIRVLLICISEQPHLYACPLLGFSGYQCPLNFSCSATASLSTNSSTISASNFSPFFTSLFRKNTTAAISLLIFYKCFITYGQLL